MLYPIGDVPYGNPNMINEGENAYDMIMKMGSKDSVKQTEKTAKSQENEMELEGWGNTEELTEKPSATKYHFSPILTEEEDNGK